MSLSIEIDLLARRYVATCFNDRNRAEWPPHPARLFSAAVAAWAGDPGDDPAEREVLQWLESLPAPVISCSLGDDVAVRSVVTHFVRVNDPAAAQKVDRAYARLHDAYEALGGLSGEDEQARPTKARDRALAELEKATARAREDSRKASDRKLAPAAIEVLPDQRGLQARTFPSVTPREPRVVFTWLDAQPTPEQRAVLDGLLARIGRLGHSSSFVSCKVTDAPPAPTLEPDGGGEVVLRVPGPGQFELLEEAYARHKGVEPRTLPAAMQPYTLVSPPAVEVPGTVFSRQWIVFVVDNDVAPVSIRASLPLARALRAALIDHVGDDPPELLTGRRPTTSGVLGRPSSRPHAAIVPLPFVGRRYADSLVRGVAIMLPAEAATDERHALLRAVAGWEQRFEGEVVVAGRTVRLARGDDLDPLATLRLGTWCRKSTEWATVTPLALDRFPGDLRSSDAQRRRAADHAACATVARACEHIGLPAPAEVVVRLDAAVRAVPPVREFPAFQTPNGGPRRSLVHAHLRFHEPIAGPVLLGAGRFVGQGLCLPLPEAGHDV